MNINHPIAINKCNSCQICGAVCPVKAISISLNEDGFYRPIIDDRKCLDCGLCTQFCYKFDDNVKITSTKDLGTIPLFSAWANNDRVISETSSGGIGDLLAKQLVSDGYKVVGVIYNEERTRAEHHIAASKEDTIAFRGSKYIQSYTFDAFQEIILNCKSEKYAVFGTPCQIYALHKFAQKKNIRNQFLFVDLYCHGCPSLFGWIKYQEYIKKKLGISKFDKVEFRSKVKGWGAYYVVVIVDGKPLFVSNPNEDGFYELFFSDQILNDSCRDCQLRGTLEYTDIRIGDFWGKKYLGNRRGVSAVSPRTELGQRVFQEILEQTTTSRCNYSEFLPFQSWGKSYSINNTCRRKMLASLRNPEEGIIDAVKVLRQNQSMTEQVKRSLKHILFYCPMWVTELLKRIK